MRGKHCYHTADNGNQRITPAGAGKTIYPFTTCINFRDHPRGCGENRQRKTFRSCPAGSPPRMRGKLQAGIDLLIALGITPADAGKTPESLFSMVRLQDHPRGCGENSAAKHLTSAGTGSPPRMRGKLTIHVRYLQTVGITPADAGKTSRHTTLRCLARDHPRGCGEN